jgi:hypothetical protein
LSGKSAAGDKKGVRQKRRLDLEQFGLHSMEVMDRNIDLRVAVHSIVDQENLSE